MDVQKRILLIDASDARREVLCRRLRAQGYAVDDTADATKGADMALSAPPAAVVADLWMHGISGLQLCRLLRAEPATADVPIVLCGERDEPRNRFWAERAGAAAYVLKGRTGELVRALSQAVDEASTGGFFVQLSGMDIRERLARHLDAALFESIIASELRALASAGSFERLFDLFAQFLSQIARYRWIALVTTGAQRLGIHHHPARRTLADNEARAALGVDASVPCCVVEDEDAVGEEAGPPCLVTDISFGFATVARFAIAPCDEEHEAGPLASIVGRELGGAIKIAALVEESQKLAGVDALTGLMNRRAYASAMATEVARCVRHGYPLALALLDIDHFKQINDTRGHQGGDRVLASLGDLLRKFLRRSDMAGRWGGEEFVVAYTSTNLLGACVAAERTRRAIEDHLVFDDGGVRIPVTASIGLACLHPGESLERLVDRADRAMYASKAAGRNRVTVCAEDAAASNVQSDLQSVA
jgi:two-component system cell cycle response regulator